RLLGRSRRFLWPRSASLLTLEPAHRLLVDLELTTDPQQPPAGDLDDGPPLPVALGDSDRLDERASLQAGLELCRVGGSSEHSSAFGGHWHTCPAHPRSTTSWRAQRTAKKPHASLAP